MRNGWHILHPNNAGIVLALSCGLKNESLLAWASSKSSVCLILTNTVQKQRAYWIQKDNGDSRSSKWFWLIFSIPETHSISFNIIQYHSISFNFAQAYAFWIHFSQQDTNKLCNCCPQLKSGVVEACSMHGAQMGTAWSLCFKAKDLLALIHLNIYMPILSDTIRYNPIPT